MFHALSAPRSPMAAAMVAAALLAAPAAAVGQTFSEWSTPASLGPIVNTSSTDGCPAIARSELTLFFASNRPGGYGGLDIYVAQRESRHDPWQPAVNAGPAINGPGNELCPTFALNSHLLLFVSDRAGGCGLQDLYVTWRRDRTDDWGWQAPRNLGCVVNSPANDFTPSLFHDETSGDVVLYFSSNRPGGPGGTDIYSSRLDRTGQFEPALIDWGLSTSADDQRPNVRKDGREIFFDSNRPGSLAGSADLWTSTRASTDQPWLPPVPVAVLNSTAVDGRPYLSFDALSLYFMSSRPGGAGGLDLFVATRTRKPATR